jgi:IS30 family transposase
LLKRAPSTVSREIRRNGGREGYRASRADHAAWDRALRPKVCKLAGNRPTPMTKPIRCHTRPSIAASSSRPVGP